MTNLVKVAHPFETAGMGTAPFRFLFCYSLPSQSLLETNPTAYNNALKDMPRDVGCGTCQHCGMGITHNYIVQSVDGIKSAVGSECIRKTGDKTLITVAEVERRKIDKKNRIARAKAARAKWLNELNADGITNGAQIDAEEAARKAARDERIAKQRAAQAAIDQEKADAVTFSRHIGKPGERVELALIYSHAASFPGTFGMFYIQTFRTQDGATVVYKGGTPISTDAALEKGARLTVKATVKEHSEYNGVKQTIVSRAKVMVPA